MKKLLDSEVDVSSPPLIRSVGIGAFVEAFGASFFIQACTVFQGILVARLLGPVGRGEYATVMLWPNVFACVGILGANISLSRAAARGADLDELVRTGVWFGLATALVTSLACYAALPWLIPPAEQHLLRVCRMFVLFIPINHVALNLLAIDQGRGDFRRYNLVRSVIYPIYLIILTALWLLGNTSVLAFTAALLAASLLTVLIRLVVVSGPLLGSVYRVRKLAKESVHFALAGIAEPVYQQADKASLLWLLGANNLGIYVVALSASAVAGTITNSAGIVTFTVAAQSRDGEGYDKVALAFRMSIILWILAGGLLALAMRPLLVLVYGTEFAAAVGPARILIVGAAFAGLARVLEQAARGRGNAFVGLGGRAAGLVTMLAMAWGGARLSFGLPGICLAFVLGQLVCLIILIVRTRSLFAGNDGGPGLCPGPADVVMLLRRARTLAGVMGRRVFQVS